jgi:hypothetical protein
LIYYLEKLDTEEKYLTNHLDYFLETINGTEANGRKLGLSPKKWDVKSIRWVLNPITHNAKISRSDERQWKKT